MSEIHPFQAIRPVKNKSCLVPTYSVDTYTHTEINRMIKSNPYSFFNIIAKPYIKNLPVQKKYQAIRKRIKKFVNNNTYITDNIPSLYVMRITSKSGHSFTGIVGLASTDEYLAGKIKRHEKIIESRARTFAEYLYHVKMNAEPVMLAHEPSESIDRIIRAAQTQIPVYEFSMTDGNVFEVWTVSRHEQIQQLQKAFAQLDALYIADGHHRIESSARLKQRMQTENPYHTGLEFYNYFMAYYIPWDQLKIYGYNRGIKKLKKPFDKILEELKQKFDLFWLDEYHQPGPREIVMMYGQQFVSLQIPERYIEQGWSVPEVVNNVIFEDIIPVDNLGNLIYCSAKNSRVCIAKRVKSNECELALFLPPVPFETIRRKADAGETLPPKSTYIDPKLLSGLFIFEF